MKKTLLLIIVCTTFGVITPHHAHADVQLVGTSTVTGSSGSMTLSLTGLHGGIGSAPIQGDLVVVLTGFASTSNQNPGVSTAGYTEVADLYANDTDDTNFSVDYKIMGATPDTSVTCNGSFSATWGAVCVAFVLRGVDTTTPLDVTSTTATGINGPNANCPAITPVSAGALILCTGMAVGSAVASAITWPSGYDNATLAASDPGTAATAAGVTTPWGGSGAVDPPAWSWTMGTASADSWAAVTLALRPAPSAPTVTTNSAESFTPTTATLFGSISVTGGSDATQSGFAYSTNSTLSSGVSTTTLGGQTGTASFSGSLNGLSPDTTYYFRAYATNTTGTGYGSILSFTTGDSTPARRMRIFEGYAVRVYDGLNIRVYPE